MSIIMSVVSLNTVIMTTHSNAAASFVKILRRRRGISSRGIEYAPTTICGLCTYASYVKEYGLLSPFKDSSAVSHRLVAWSVT